MKWIYATIEVEDDNDNEVFYIRHNRSNNIVQVHDIHMSEWLDSNEYVTERFLR